MVVIIDEGWEIADNPRAWFCTPQMFVSVMWEMRPSIEIYKHQKAHHQEMVLVLAKSKINVTSDVAVVEQINAFVHKVDE